MPETRPQFTPTNSQDLDIPVMCGGNTAIFYAKWDPNRSMGRDGKDLALFSQRPEFKCRSLFDEFTVTLNGSLPTGVELVKRVYGNYATFDLTTSVLAPPRDPPTRLIATVRCVTKGGTSVVPTFWSTTKEGAEVPLDARYLPYENYWLPSVEEFEVELVIHTHDEPWITSPTGELKVVCEVGTPFVIQFDPQTILEWDANVVYDWFGVPLAVPLSTIDLGGGAHNSAETDRRHGVWCVYTIFLTDNFDIVDLDKQTGLFVKFPGHGDDDFSLNTGLQAQGPITIFGTPTIAGNTYIEVYLHFGASIAHSFKQGWWENPDGVKIVIPITILEKKLPPGRVVVLRQQSEHVEDSLLVSGGELPGSWRSSESLIQGLPMPAGGFARPPDPPHPGTTLPPQTGGTAVRQSNINSTNRSVTFDSPHGLGPVGSTLTLKFTSSAGTPPEGLVSGQYYTATIVSPDTITIQEITGPASADFVGAFIPEHIPNPVVDPPPSTDWSYAGPYGPVVTGTVTDYPISYINIIPGDKAPHRYGPGPAGEDLDDPGSDASTVQPDENDPLDYTVWVPSIVIGVEPTKRPLALTAYAVGVGVDRSSSVLPDTGIRTAFGWQYAYNPSSEVVVPEVTTIDPTFIGLAIAPYPVDAGIEYGYSYGNDPGILSAFVYRYAYNPTAERLVEAPDTEYVSLNNNTWPASPFNKWTADSAVGGTGILSAFGYQYVYNPTDEIDVPSVTTVEPNAMGIQRCADILSAFGYTRPYNPVPEVVAPSVEQVNPRWATPLTVGYLIIKIASALNWKVAYNPTQDVSVGAVDIDINPTTRPWALTAYTVGIGVDASVSTLRDTGIRSAFMWQYAYNPSEEVVIADIRRHLGIIRIISAQGFAQWYSPAPDIQVESVFGWPADARDNIDINTDGSPPPLNVYEQTEPKDNVLSLVPYLVNENIDHSGYASADPGILSALMFRSTYNLALDVAVDDTIIDFDPTASLPFTATV